MITKHHHYPEISSSPWPLLSRASAFVLITSLILFFKTGEAGIFIISLSNLTFRSFIWWKDFREETNEEGKINIDLENRIKISIIMFISSEVLFFTSFFWSYFHFMASPTIETGLAWPPILVRPFDYKNIPLINTAVLLTSGITVTMRHASIIKGEIRKSYKELIMTIILGIVFRILQLIEYNSSFFSISDSTFGRTFFMITGFHGIHVVIGFFFLAKVIRNISKIYSSKDNYLRFELASWYWHFVDVIWLIVYFTLYYLNI